MGQLDMDRLLADVFSQEQGPLPDEGFTEKVLVALPRHRIDIRLRYAILTCSVAIGCLLSFLLHGQEPVLDGLYRAIYFVGNGWSGTLIGISESVIYADPVVVVALFIVGLIVLNRGDNRRIAHRVIQIIRARIRV